VVQVGEADGTSESDPSPRVLQVGFSLAVPLELELGKPLGPPLGNRLGLKLGEALGARDGFAETGLAVGSE
jgi:hypothetical protein